MNKKFSPYKDRKGRAKFVSIHLKSYIDSANSVLDVGCWENDLKEWLGGNEKVTGIDIGGKPDIKIDLEEKINSIDDASYDLVTCTDVLEHINNLHQLFGELVRMTKKHIIISLPTMHLMQRLNFLMGKPTKYYGLPAETPTDRHRWIFSFDDAQNFMGKNAKKYNLRIVEQFPHYNYTNSLLGRLAKLLIKTKVLPGTLMAQTYWVVLEKNE